MTRLEILKQVYVALNQGKIPDVLKFFAPDILRVETWDSPSTGTYRGMAEVEKHFSRGRGTWAEGTCEPEGFAESGDKVAVHVHVRVRLKDRTNWTEGWSHDVFAFRGEKIIEMRSFLDKQEALAWAGVEDL